MSASLPAVLGFAAGAFASTNLDNAVVTVAMVASAPPDRARRIAAGQLIGFVALVLGAIGMALLLFEISTRVVGLLGLVPLTLGLRGLIGLRHTESRARLSRRAFGNGFFAASLVTIGAGGDNLAVYIPLFRVARVRGSLASLLIFAVGETLLTLFIVRAGGHPRVRGAISSIGVVTTPVLYCAIGVLVLIEAGTLSALW
jgi:cadmium resistance protein CadD (predicted permease)